MKDKFYFLFYSIMKNNQKGKIQLRMYIEAHDEDVHSFYTLLEDKFKYLLALSIKNDTISQTYTIIIS